MLHGAWHEMTLCSVMQYCTTYQVQCLFGYGPASVVIPDLWPDQRIGACKVAAIWANEQAFDSVLIQWFSIAAACAT